MARLGERAYFVFSGLLLLVGSLLSTSGGRSHPTISEEMGEYGSREFFNNFASVINNDPDWEPVHAQIIAGPLLWTLGGVALVALARAAGGRRWSMLGTASLAMGAVLWTVTYIFDGFVANRVAAFMGSDPALDPAYTVTFAAGQWVAIRTSYVAWLLITLGTVAFALSMVGLARRSAGLQRVLAYVLVGLGSALGLWTFLAAALGGLEPGPMVTPWYLPALIGTQWWYILAAVLIVHRTLVRPRARRTAEPRPAETPEQARAH